MTTASTTMTLVTYQSLIQNLPYKDQAFQTRQSTWIKECNHYPGFAHFCAQHFQDGRLKLSRRDLFEKANRSFTEAFFSIILWGYPRNMRGRSFATILDHIEPIQKAFAIEKHLTAASFTSLRENLKGTGVGFSTLTKMLYFFRFTLESLPCLILDSHIIAVCREGLYQELAGLQKISSFNKQAEYYTYLQQMHQIAETGGYTADQLELFLYRFSRNLKVPCCHQQKV